MVAFLLLVSFIMIALEHPFTAEGWVSASAPVKRSGRVMTTSIEVHATSWIYLRDARDMRLFNQRSGNNQQVQIRDGLHGELGGAADVIMSSFYVNSTALFKPMLRLAELNRLQQAFPYADPSHRMLVAISDNNTVVGFCDIDNRPATSNVYKFNPRPYLSDLCIDPSYRKQGIARDLILTCEEYCIDVLKKSEVYIRVERSNEAVLSMYLSMGYCEIDHPDDKEGTVCMLRKDLSHRKDRALETSKNDATPAESL